MKFDGTFTSVAVPSERSQRVERQREDERERGVGTEKGIVHTLAGVHRTGREVSRVRTGKRMVWVSTQGQREFRSFQLFRHRRGWKEGGLRYGPELVQRCSESQCQCQWKRVSPSTIRREVRGSVTHGVRSRSPRSIVRNDCRTAECPFEFTTIGFRGGVSGTTGGSEGGSTVAS